MTDQDKTALLSKLRAEGVQAGDERAALAWYAEQVAGCRKIGADGDAARQALDKDGGRRARAALASTPVAMIDTAKLAQLLDSVNGDCYLGKEKEEELAQFLRSQLRAPVADESPMAKVADALREKARQEQQAYQERREADRPASAPVANTAAIIREVCETDPAEDGPDTIRITVQDLTRIVGGYRAPVAGEAQPVAWEDVRDALAMFLSGATGKASKHWIEPLEDATANGPLAKMRACLAAPQASEADDLIGALGQCRDAFPIPATAGSPLDLLWQEAMSDPAAVPAYVKACASNGQASEAAPFSPDWANYRQGVADGKAEASEAVRTPDYTLQHADHMAVSAERLMEAVNNRDAVIMQREESDDVDDDTLWDQHETVSEYLRGMREAIYEYRKRRLRAAPSPTPSVVKQSLTATQTGEKGEQ